MIYIYRNDYSALDIKLKQEKDVNCMIWKFKQKDGISITKFLALILPFFIFT